MNQSITPEDEWLWGWDPTPGIVSIWAERDGNATIWRRTSATEPVITEHARFRPWLLLPSLDDVAHLGDRLQPHTAGDSGIAYRKLDGPGHLRYLVNGDDGRELEAAVLTGASQRLGRSVPRLSDLGDEDILCLSPEEQYLVATGRTYFRDLSFADLHRLQFDLETTGLHAERDAIFLVSVHSNRGLAQVLDVSERGLRGPAAEADLIRRLAMLIRTADPDVIENHNLQGFDLPFLATRARILGLPLHLGRAGMPGLRQRSAGRGYGAWRSTETGNPAEHQDRSRAVRYMVPGRELIDTLDAVRRYDFAARDLPGHGLKAVARHFGLASAERVYLDGPRIFATWKTDPDRVRRYALDDVLEVDGLANLLGGAAFALARMAPRRYERLADAGPATGVLDPLLVRAYLRSNQALPGYTRTDGTQHSGAALHLFAAGVAWRIVKADVSSLYPSLMRHHRISPRSDHLGALLALVDRLVEQRLAAKSRAKGAAPGSSERHTDEALSAAMKILVNSAYGYLGATGLTRFADVHAANEVTRYGRATLALMCCELAARGVTLLEADTDGVYFAVPPDWSEDDERRVVTEVAALLPPLVRLEVEGRYAAMFSHEPKNYALLTYSGDVILRGVAFHSIKFEPFGETFLRGAIGCLLHGDIAGVRAAYLAMAADLQARSLPTAHLATRTRLTKTPQQYDATRADRREAHYEALIAAGRTTWERGASIHLYRATNNRVVLLPEDADSQAAMPRDYDTAYYLRLLRDTYSARLTRAFTPDDFATLFADPTQPSLFAPLISDIRSTLTMFSEPLAALLEG